MQLAPFATLLLAASLLAASLQAQTTLLVLSKQDHTLAAVDPTSLKILFTAPIGPDPHEVIASADGRTAYISNYGGGTLNTLAVIDLVARKALPSIDLGPLHGPHGLTFVGGKLWFTTEGSKTIGRFDPSTQKVDWVLGTGQNRTHMIDVSPDQKHIVTTNVASATVSLIDLEPLPAGPQPNAPVRYDWNQTIIPVGRGDEGFDISPDRTQLWTANAQDGTISVIDLASRKVIDTLAANVTSANRLKFTPDGRTVLVSLLNNPDLVLLDAATRKVTHRLQVGRAAGILIDPNGNRAFIACTPENYVAVLDLHTLKVTTHIPIGGPDGMAWAVHP